MLCHLALRIVDTEMLRGGQLTLNSGNLDQPPRSTRRANSEHSATLYIMSRARDQNWGPTYLRRLISDCPCSGNSSVGVTWPTSMPGVTDVLMYFISPAANWNVTAFSTSVAVVTAYFPGGRSTKAKPPGTDLPTTSLFIRISG